ncbi:MAG: helix-turn-helix transcriptional regulator [Clostridiales bacterium]|nr:helix-turn-helix transcriptional regulator [Clostridiales bacterium]HOC09514.1 helix-turn-helix transcriptional regulator [Bacillota bacterium]HQD41570.1 helix-turn-helix transcriptional regulator [Bacillota bacterium]
MVGIKLSDRQMQIVEIVKSQQPITSEQVAERLNLTRAALRSDLSILTMAGILEARPKVGYSLTGRIPTNMIADFINNILVKDIKTRPVVVNVDTSVYDCIVSLFLEDVGTIFVQSGGYLAGVASRKDLLKHAIGKTDLDRIPISVVMTRMPNIVTLQDEETLAMAIAKMVEHEVDCIPVVTREDTGGREKLKITGRVSKTGIITVIHDMLKE